MSSDHTFIVESLSILGPKKLLNLIWKWIKIIIVYTTLSEKITGSPIGTLAVVLFFSKKSTYTQKHTKACFLIAKAILIRLHEKSRLISNFIIILDIYNNTFSKCTWCWFLVAVWSSVLFTPTFHANAATLDDTSFQGQLSITGKN